jgi:hypothetical protein
VFDIACASFLAPLRRCGPIASARIRSVALDPESKVPRRAALMTGQGRSTTREAVNGYIVFKEAQGAWKWDGGEICKW